MIFYVQSNIKKERDILDQFQVIFQLLYLFPLDNRAACGAVAGWMIVQTSRQRSKYISYLHTYINCSSQLGRWGPPTKKVIQNSVKIYEIDLIIVIIWTFIVVWPSIRKRYQPLVNKTLPVNSCEGFALATQRKCFWLPAMRTTLGIVPTGRAAGGGCC